MRTIRLLAVALLAAGIVALVGELTPAADGPVVAKKGKNKNKKNAQPPAVVNDVAAPSTPTKPVAQTAYQKLSPAAITQLINEQINSKLADAKIIPSSNCSDHEFLRRVYLDLTGVIPSAERARAFLDDPTSNKRAKLIDELLASNHYGRHQADLWMSLIVQRTSDNKNVDFSPTRAWLDGQFDKNRPWNDLVTDLITADGKIEDNPAIGFYLSNNTVDKMTDSCGKVFLGVQIQCAQCHNHPFNENWKQNDYWGLAQFFIKTSVGKLNGKAPDLSVSESQAQKKGKKAMLPDSAKFVPAKYLGGDQPRMTDANPARPVLAKWLTAADNPFFARAMVNRTWAQLMGRGFVNPVDDMSPENAASHPELLAKLTAEFAGGGFDVKALIRNICNSQAYQRSSKSTPENSADKELVSHAGFKIMSPEQMYDSLSEITGKIPDEARIKGVKMAVGKGAGLSPRDRFVTFYLAGADAANPVEYEAGIPQALKLMNSPVTGNPAVVQRIIAGGTNPTVSIERIYLTSLSRRPTADEIKMLTAYIEKSGNVPKTYQDILWATLNSSEFATVR